MQGFFTGYIHILSHTALPERATVIQPLLMWLAPLNNSPLIIRVGVCSQILRVDAWIIGLVHHKTTPFRRLDPRLDPYYPESCLQSNSARIIGSAWKNQPTVIVDSLLLTLKYTFPDIFPCLIIYDIHCT